MAKQPSAAVRILWLDSEPQYLSTYLDACEDAGFKVTRASSVIDALQYLQDNPAPTLIITEMILPPGPFAQEESEGDWEQARASTAW